jgi:hypothetical protein
MCNTKRTLFVVLAVVAVAVPVAAAADAELDVFRAELTEYVVALEGLPQALLSEVFDGQPPFPELKQQIATMPEGELRKMHDGLSKLPYWRQLPSMLARSAPPAGTPSPTELESLLDQRVGSVDSLREETLRLVDGLRSLAEGTPDSAGYMKRIDAIEAQIVDLSFDELIVLQRGMVEMAPRWRQTLEQAASGATMPVHAKASCGQSFPAGVLCEIQNIINEIAAIPGHIVAFAESAFNSILAVFNTVVDAFPSDPNDILQAMGLDDPNWFNTILGSIPVLSPPCPSGDLPFLGTVGTIEAEYRCKRDLEWISEAIYENAPDDIWGVPLKIPATVVHYPINYLCLCMEAEARITFDDDQLAHRELVSQMLDVTVSSRSTQTSVDTAQAATWDIDGDVAVIEAKLDVIESKTDTLIDGSGAQTSFLDEFEGLTLRMRIEADLTRKGNDRVSLFQLPVDFGGYLEVARAVVADTIATAAAAGADTRQAERDLEDGDFAYGDGFFKDAYRDYRDAYRHAMRSLR